MGGRRRRQLQQSSKLAMVFFHALLALFFSTAPVHGLNVGIQSSNSDLTTNKDQNCSRKCESENCAVPPFLRYGKYCGILYSGCPGEKPCDALDACCMTHDACVQAKNNDYLSEECNENLLNCIRAVKARGGATFQGNKCLVEEVVDVITVVIEAAVIAGRVLHKP